MPTNNTIFANAIPLSFNNEPIRPNTDDKINAIKIFFFFISLNLNCEVIKSHSTSWIFHFAVGY